MFNILVKCNCVAGVNAVSISYTGNLILLYQMVMTVYKYNILSVTASPGVQYSIQVLIFQFLGLRLQIYQNSLCNAPPKGPTIKNPQ